MPAIIIEIGYPKNYIEERWKIEVKKRMNIPKNEIIIEKNRKRGSDPNSIEAFKSLLVGREVSSKEIEAFCKGYFYGSGLWEKILRMQLL